MKKSSKVPTTAQRLEGVLSDTLDVDMDGGLLGLSEAADGIISIHRANMAELLEDVELLIDPAKASDFATLKKSYLS